MVADAGVAYLEELAVEAVVIRPDRYIMGIAQDIGQLRDLIGDIPFEGR